MWRGGGGQDSGSKAVRMCVGSRTHFRSYEPPSSSSSYSPQKEPVLYHGLNKMQAGDCIPFRCSNLRYCVTKLLSSSMYIKLQLAFLFMLRTMPKLSIFVTCYSALSRTALTQFLFSLGNTHICSNGLIQ